MIATFSRYVLGGIAAVLAHFIILVCLIEVLGFNPLIATSIGFGVAVIVNYNVQYYWTFSARGPHTTVFFRYVAVTLPMLGLNLLLFWTLIQFMHLQYIYAQLLATATIMSCNFTINRLYIFNHE